MVQAILSRIVSNVALVWFVVGLFFDQPSGALQFLGNLFEYFLVRKNEGRTGPGTPKAIVSNSMVLLN